MSIFDSMNNITHSTHVQAHQSALAQSAAGQVAQIQALASAAFWNPPLPTEEEVNKEKARLIQEFLKFSPDYREAYINSLKAKAIQDAMSPGSVIKTPSAFLTIHGHQGKAITISIAELENAHCSGVIEDLLED